MRRMLQRCADDSHPTIHSQTPQAQTTTQQVPRDVRRNSTAAEADGGEWGPPDALTADDRLAILELCHR